MRGFEISVFAKPPNTDARQLHFDMKQVDTLRATVDPLGQHVGDLLYVEVHGYTKRRPIRIRDLGITAIAVSKGKRHGGSVTRAIDAV